MSATLEAEKISNYLYMEAEIKTGRQGGHHATLKYQKVEVCGILIVGRVMNRTSFTGAYSTQFG